MLHRLLPFLIFIGFCIPVESQMLTHLVPPNTATHTAIQNGSWFDPNTWNTGTVPGNAAIVVIPSGVSVTYQGQSNGHVFEMRLFGIWAEPIRTGCWTI